VSRYCPACAGETDATHTCAGSGTFLAAEAHASGEVEAMAEAWPTYEATIHLRLRAPEEEDARRGLTKLMEELLDDALVTELDFSIRPYQVTA